ncbi:head-tail connector protein [Paenibacillus sp. TRM 82003]|nr:head-tail connector protein [Paenibacillus sp. TRM 82003]
MLDDAKIRLRISNTAFDSEILDLIEEAKADLSLSGIASLKVNDDTDPLIRRAVFLYVKANFGWDNNDSDKLTASYGMLKNHLALSAEYTESGA